MDKHQTQAIEHFMGILSQMPSIRFIEFVEADDYRYGTIKFLSLKAGKAEELISECDPTICSDSAEWVRNVVIQMNIEGNFFFYFDDRSSNVPIPWPVLFLSDDYSWVEPLWNLGHSFVFIPPDFSYILHILWEENAYKAFLTYRDEIPQDTENTIQ